MARDDLKGKKLASLVDLVGGTPGIGTRGIARGRRRSRSAGPLTSKLKRPPSPKSVGSDRGANSQTPLFARQDLVEKITANADRSPLDQFKRLPDELLGLTMFWPRQFRFFTDAMQQSLMQPLPSEQWRTLLPLDPTKRPEYRDPRPIFLQDALRRRG